MSSPLPEKAFRRLLLIDDEAGIRKMLGKSLALDGYQVSLAGDGREGLALFESEKPDLVVTDLKMPGMDGLQVLAAVKRASHPAEVVVITGHGDLELAIRALQLEASDFVTKPINDEALEIALERARERLALKAELAQYTAGLEAKVAEATARLLAAERLAAVGQTVASLGHTLKNMLVGLNAALYMLQKARDGHAQRLEQGVDMLERNLGRVKRLVKDLLHLASVGEPEKEPLDLAELAAEAAEHLASRAEAQGVGLELDACQGGCRLRGDRAALLDALLNLVSNALDAAGQVEGGRVRLSLVRDRDEAVFRVEDNGPGLTEEAEQRIFQGFYTGKGTEGTGLGLMISNKTAAQHGGRVWCSRPRGGGACFCLSLPLEAQGREERRRGESGS